MKALLVGLAITVLYSVFLVFQWDNNLYRLKLEELKTVANECSAAAALFYEVSDFKEGHKVFNREEGNEAIKYLLLNNLKLNENLHPTVYWSDKIDYYVFYFDDSRFVHEYHNGEYIDSTLFLYGDIFTDPLQGYKKVIGEPIVIVTISAGRPPFRLSFLKLNKICGVRSSAYEYVDRE